MATEGIEGFYIETRNYGSAGAFWGSMGYTIVFETDHGSGQWVHPAGGPYLFIAEQQDRELETHPILKVSDSTAFAPERPPEYTRPFAPTHWGVVEAIVRDPDGRPISLQAPLPDGVTATDAQAHHDEKYGAR